MTPTEFALPDVRDVSGEWVALRRAMLLYGALMLLSLLSGWSSRLTSSPWVEVVYSGVSTVLVVGVALVVRLPERAAFGLPRAGGRAWGMVLIVSAGSVLLLTLYFGLLEAVGVPFIDVGASLVRAEWPWWSAYLLFALHPAIVEELAFRGVLQSLFSVPLRRRQALVVQAGLFSVLHLSPVIFPSHFLMGLVVGWVRLRTGSLLPGVLMHAAWNAYALA